jgi:hypothetical protein
MVSLRANQARQWAFHVFVAAQVTDEATEIPLRLPAKFTTSPFVDIDAIDAREHLPAAARVRRLVIRDA